MTLERTEKIIRFISLSIFAVAVIYCGINSDYLEMDNIIYKGQISRCQ